MVEYWDDGMWGGSTNHNVYWDPDGTTINDMTLLKFGGRDTTVTIVTPSNFPGTLRTDGQLPKMTQILVWSFRRQL